MVSSKTKSDFITTFCFSLLMKDSRNHLVSDLLLQILAVTQHPTEQTREHES
jgi:hypothetical protein